MHCQDVSSGQGGDSVAYDNDTSTSDLVLWVLRASLEDVQKK